MNAINPQIQRSWTQVSDLFRVQNEQDYDRAVERLNTLLDEVGTDERHPLYSLLDTLGTVLHAWEEQHHAMPEFGGADLLRFFMEAHNLSQSDLPEVGSRGRFGNFERQTGTERQANTRFVRALRCLTLSICLGSIDEKVYGPVVNSRVR